MVRRGAPARPAAVDRGRRRPRRTALLVSGALGPAEAGATAARRVARRPGQERVAAGGTARRRLAPELLDPGGGGGRARRRRGGGGRRRPRDRGGALRRPRDLRARRDPRAPRGGDQGSEARRRAGRAHPGGATRASGSPRAVPRARVLEAGPRARARSGVMGRRARRRGTRDPPAADVGAARASRSYGRGISWTAQPL